MKDATDRPISFSTEELILDAEAEQHEGESEQPDDEDNERHGLFAQPGWMPLKLRTDI